ncbi:hypothetical protein BGZ72_006322 [Mortierella alpina]|nr:hypothetical protein BGZ72_006322 [Mortierella alpina]
MGVSGAFGFLQQKGVEGTPKNPKSLPSVLVDRSSSTLLFPAPATRQKARAQAKRQQDKDDAANALDVALDANEAIADAVLNEDPERPLKQSLRKKLVRTYKCIASKWQSVRRIDLDTWRSLSNYLRQQGWHVHNCYGEVDLFVAQLVDSGNSGVIVASEDSDFLFHGVATLLRPNPSDRSSYLQYDVEEVLQKLSVSSLEWRIIAITSGNDYSANYPNRGISKNLDDITTISQAMKERMPRLNQADWTREDIETLIEEYVEQLPEQVRMRDGTIFLRSDLDFCPAKEVFLDHHEDTLELVRNTPENTGAHAIDRILTVYDKAARALKTLRRHRHHNRLSSLKGYKTMMPTNTYRVRTYVPKSVAEAQPSSDERRKKRKRRKKKAKGKRKKRKTIYNRASRAHRATAAAVKGAGANAEDAASSSTSGSTGRTNKINSSHVTSNCLQQRFGTVSLTCGTLKARLRDGMASNHVGDTDSRATLLRLIPRTINDMVKIGTDITRHAEHAVALFTVKIMVQHPSVTDAQDIAARKRELGFLSSHTSAFFGNLFHSIYTWNEDHPRQKKGRPRAENDDNRRIDTILGDYDQLLQDSGGMQRVRRGHDDDIHTGLAPFLRLAGERFADTVQVHYKTNISELVERIREQNRTWAASEEGRAVLDEIDEHGESRSRAHDIASLFWILNSHLPANKRIAFFPESGFGDKFFTITEEHLVMVLMRQDSTTLKPMQSLFGTQTLALEYVRQHPGDFFFRLFFSKEVDYIAGTCLINPGSDIATGRQFLHFGPRDQKKFEKLQRTMLETNNADHKKAREDFKAFVYDNIGTADTRRDLIKDGRDWRRRVLTGSISTNGHELLVLAYSLSQKPPPKFKKKIAKTTRNKLPSLLDKFGTSQDKVGYFSGQRSQVIVGIDPGIKSTATACIIDFSNPDRPRNLTISQGSHTCITKAFNRGLERAKAKHDVCSKERTIKPVECPVASVGQQLDCWIALQKSIKDHIKSFQVVQGPLRQFYGTQMFKIKSFHRKQALTATSNKGMDRLISAATATAERPLFVMGDGEFGAWTRTFSTRTLWTR